MSHLRERLIKALSELPDVRVELWKDSGLLCVYCRGKEIAHFQSASEIDISLSPTIIKREGLQPPQNTTSHLDRSKNSRWIVQSFTSKDDLDDILRLVALATELC